MKNKSIYLIAVFIMCLVLSAVSCDSNSSQNFLPTESISIQEEVDINSFPITSEQMKKYLESQYVDAEETAGFTLVINDPDDYRNMDFAYYIFSLIDIYNIETPKSLLDDYKLHFEKYKFNFSELELEELYRIAFISSKLNTDIFHSDLKMELKNHYSDKSNLYFYSSDDNIMAMFGATYLSQKIYSLLGENDMHIADIRISFDSNVAAYLDEVKIEEGMLNKSYYNLILCSNQMNYELQHLNIDFVAWLKSVNEDIVLDNSYNYANIYAINQVFEINTQFSNPQNGIENLLKSISLLTNSSSPRFEYSSSMSDILILRMEKELSILAEPKDSVKEFISMNLRTNFIKKDMLTSTSMYTYYGMVLSDVFKYPYDSAKVKESIKTNFIPNIINSNNVMNQNYIIDSYFTASLIQYINYSLTKEEVNLISHNINLLLTKIEYTDLTKAYENLYSLQFSIEISKMFNFSIAEEEIGRAKNFLSYLVNNNILNGTAKLSEIKIIYLLLDINIPESFSNQFNETLQQLSYNGGFLNSSAEKANDLITTSKIYRTEKCSDAFQLEKFLDNFVVDNYISPNNDITTTDLRYYYNFYRLWLLTQTQEVE